MKRLIVALFVLVFCLSFATDSSAKKPLAAKCKKDNLVNAPIEIQSVVPINATSIQINAGGGYDASGSVYPDYYEFITPGHLTVTWCCAMYELLDDQIRNFIPGAPYAARLLSRDLCGNTAWSSWFYFAMPDVSGDTEAPVITGLSVTHKLYTNYHAIKLYATDNDGIKEIEFWFEDQFLMLYVPDAQLREAEDDLYMCADYSANIIGQYGTVTVRVHDWNGNVSETSIQAEM